MTKIETQETTNVGKDVEKKEPSCPVGGDTNCTATVENSTDVPQKVKNRTTL